MHWNDSFLSWTESISHKRWFSRVFIVNVAFKCTILNYLLLETRSNYKYYIQLPAIVLSFVNRAQMSLEKCFIPSSFIKFTLQILHSNPYVISSKGLMTKFTMKFLKYFFCEHNSTCNLYIAFSLHELAKPFLFFKWNLFFIYHIDHHDIFFNLSFLVNCTNFIQVASLFFINR